MDKLYPYLFGILGLITIGGMAIQQAFFSRLRKLHTGIWDQLGKPVIFLNNGTQNGMAFVKFMWRREYESLPDRKTVAFGRFLRAYLLFYMIFFTLMVIGFILTVKPHK
jgi:hypothetical protein